MRRLSGIALSTVLLSGLCAAGALKAMAADAPEPVALLDKAAQALGGAEKLGKIKAASWTAKGTITFMGMDNPVTYRRVVQGLDRSRSEFEANIAGMEIKGVAVASGDKGWLNFGGSTSELNKEMLANEKRTTYLTVIPAVIYPLKEKGFKLESTPAVTVNGKSAPGIKVTPPDGKEFSLYFDPDSGLPARVVGKVLDFMGQEFTQETNLSEYKEVGGVKIATKLESKRDGEKFMNQEISDFKVLEQVDPKTFDQP
jgi:hypothetical protein